MIDPQIKQYIDQQIATSQKNAKFSTSNVSFVRHNGIDAPKVSYNDLTDTPAISTAPSVSGVTSVTGTSGQIVVSPTTGDPIVGLATSGVGAGLYYHPNLIVDTYGRITTIEAGTIKGFNASRALNAASSTQTIAHNLGNNPSFCRITASFSGGSTIVGTSSGNYDGTTQNYSYSILYANSGGSSSGNNGTGSVLYFVLVAGGPNGAYCSMTWDSTNIYLAWTLVGAGLADTCYISGDAQV